MGPDLSTDGVDDLLEAWEAPHVGVGLRRSDGSTLLGGDVDRPFALASVTKPIVALAALVAVEEGAMRLADPAGPEGSTVRHLLAHASGLDFDSPRVVAAPGTRRIYSNTGFEALAAHLAEATGIAWQDYVTEAVTGPLGMGATTFGPSAARDATSTVTDLVALCAELLAPTLIGRSTLATAVEPTFGDLDGVVPGFGTQRPCPWGLGFELKGDKHPHWTAPGHSPATFGHFGAAGTFVWVDPSARAAAVGLSDRPFGPWAVELWPRLNQQLLDRSR